MNDEIFLIQPTGELVGMQEAAYDSELILQKLLESYPALLAGGQIDRDNPRRWLLISREIGISDGESLGARWALDHLFVDQDAVPTLVEVKRSTDTRIRREVVGQMLDYAANCASYWTLDVVRRYFDETCLSQGRSSEEVLGEFLESTQTENVDLEQFWKAFESNLRAGRMRMLFVADSIPRELQRIIEFLNEQMESADVLGLEIKQFRSSSSPSIHTMVPRVIGHTAVAQQLKKAAGGRPSRKWTEESFFVELKARRPDVVDVAQKLAIWGKQHTSYLWFGEGALIGSIVPTLKLSQKHQLFAVWTSGVLETYFQWYAGKAPFNDLAKRRLILDRLNQMRGLSFQESILEKRPSFDLTLLNDPDNFEIFIDTFEWIIAEIRRSETTAT
jgi:hypothetical protein